MRFFLNWDSSCGHAGTGWDPAEGGGNEATKNQAYLKVDARADHLFLLFFGPLTFVPAQNNRMLKSASTVPQKSEPGPPSEPGYLQVEASAPDGVCGYRRYRRPAPFSLGAARLFWLHSGLGKTPRSLRSRQAASGSSPLPRWIQERWS